MTLNQWAQANPVVLSLVAGLAMVLMFVIVVLSLRYFGTAGAQVRQHRHAERIKALELGQPLPDAQAARLTAAGLVAVSVPLICCGCATLATTLGTRHLSSYDTRLALILASWISAGVVSLVAQVCSLRMVHGYHPADLRSSAPPTEAAEDDIPG